MLTKVLLSMPACLLLLALSLAARAEVRFELRNDGPDLFQHVAEIDLTAQPALAPPAGRTVPAVTAADGAPVAAQFYALDGEPRLLVAVSGLWATGETRRFRLAWGAAQVKVATDLTTTWNSEGVAVDNAYHGVTFPLRGNGGFPTEVRFHVSGTVERGFTFEDRLFDRERGYFRPQADPQAPARAPIVGPLRVVVEQQFRFLGGKGNTNPGGARGVYRWVITAHSPIVRVEGHISRESDLDFTWPELHFLQISRGDARFSRWAGGDPPASGTLGPKSHGVAFSRWGVLSSGLDALGMALEGGLGFWDGTSEYVTYLQRCEAWSGGTRDLAADLYLGPAREPARISAALLLRPAISVMVAAEAAREAPSTGESVAALRSERLALLFTKGPGGSVGLAGMATVPDKHQFIPRQTPGAPRLWRLHFHKLGLGDLDLTSEQAGACQVTSGAEEATFAWTGLDLGEERGVIDVEVRVRLPKTAATSLWRIKVANRSARYGLWEVQFPVINGLSASGRCDVAVPRSNWGILYEKLAEGQAGSYPSAHWPFQMLTLNEGREGVYLACHDPGAWPKNFSLTPGGEFHFAVYAENMGVPGSGFETPGEVAVGVYHGDWLTGCKRYREWALANAPWTKMGKLSQRADTPKAFRELGLWMIGGGKREEIVPSMLKAADFFQVPMGLHWYSWHEIPFDTHYPEYFPYKPGFPEGVKAFTDRGLYAMPYINGRLHDMDIPSFAEARPWCTKREDGEPYLEVYPSQARQAVMCPFTQYWQDRLNGVIRRLVTECGVNAIYIDQIGAAGPQLCFDPKHGHPLGGGRHWVDGYRALLKQTKAIGHSGGREVAFTTENNAEPYLDGVDAFLIWNPRQAAEVPMMTGVYSGYTVYFSSPVSLGGGAHSFWMAQARDFLWGCQLGWMSPDEFLSPANRRLADDLKRLGRYRVACRKFLTYGELVGRLEPVEPLPEVTGRWNDWSGKLSEASLPAVQTAVWRAEDGTLGLFFANLADRPVRFAYDLSPSRFGGSSAKKGWLQLTRLSPEGREVAGFLPVAGGRRTEYLDADEILVYEVAPADGLPVVGLQSAGGSHTGARPVDRAALDAWALGHGVSWECRFPEEGARGETVTGELVVKNAGQRPIKVAAGVTPKGSSSTVGPAVAVAPGETKRLPLPVSPPSSMGDLLDLRVAIRLSDEEAGALGKIPLSVALLEPISVSVEPPAGDIRAGESVPLCLRVANHRSVASDAVVGLRTPAGWELWPGPTVRVPALQPGEERRVWLLAEISPTAAPAPAPIEAFLIGSRTSTEVRVLPPRPQAQAPRLATPPPIDGRLGEWRDVPAVTLGPPNAANLKDYGGESDLSGQVQLAWDAANLYFAATVTDQTFAQTHQHKDMWQGDCIQLALRPGSLPRRKTYDGVRELGFALTSSGPELWRWMPTEGVVTEGGIAVLREGARTIYEVAIPWSRLGVQPSSGAALACALTLNDDDGAGFRGWLEWGAGLCGDKDASRFGVLTLG